jgi:hypothetical protein
MTRAARRPATALLLGLVGASSACSAWRVQSVAPAELLRTDRPPTAVRLRLQDSTRVVLLRPHLADDSVTGTLKGAKSTVPLSAITEVALRRFSPERTVGLVALGVASLYAVAAVACAAQGGCGPDFDGFSLGQ